MNKIRTREKENGGCFGISTRGIDCVTRLHGGHTVPEYLPQVSQITKHPPLLHELLVVGSFRNTNIDVFRRCNFVLF